MTGIRDDGGYWPFRKPVGGIICAPKVAAFGLLHYGGFYLRFSLAFDTFAREVFL